MFNHLKMFLTPVVLACRQVWHEWLSALCICIALVAVIVPVLVMTGLKNGIIKSETDKLLHNPNTLMLLPTGIFDFNKQWDMDKLISFKKSIPEIETIIPQPGDIKSATAIETEKVKVENPKNWLNQTALRITKPGDLALVYYKCAIPDNDEIVLNHAEAERLKVQIGDSVSIRGFFAETQFEKKLNVVGIIPPDYISYDGSPMRYACVTLELANAVHDFYQGHSVPLLTNEATKNQYSPTEVYKGVVLLNYPTEHLNELPSDKTIFKTATKLPLGKSTSNEQTNNHILVPFSAPLLAVYEFETLQDLAKKNLEKQLKLWTDKRYDPILWNPPLSDVLAYHPNDRFNTTLVSILCPWETPSLLHDLQSNSKDDHCIVYKNKGPRVHPERVQALMSSQQKIIAINKALYDTIIPSSAWNYSYTQDYNRLLNEKKTIDKAINELTSKVDTLKEKSKPDKGKSTPKKDAKEKKEKEPKLSDKEQAQLDELAQLHTDERLWDLKINLLEKSRLRHYFQQRILVNEIKNSLKKESELLLTRFMEIEKNEPMWKPNTSLDQLHAEIKQASALLHFLQLSQESGSFLEFSFRPPLTKQLFTADQLYPPADDTPEELLCLEQSSKQGKVNSRILVEIRYRYNLRTKDNELLCSPQDLGKLSRSLYTAFEWNYKKKSFIPALARKYKFVAFARNIDDIIIAKNKFENLGIECVSAEAEIIKNKKLNDHLSSLLLIISLLGGGGACLSLIINIFNATERRKKDYALLRTMGMGRLSVSMMPVVESFILMGSTLTLSFSLYYGIEYFINSYLYGVISDQKTLCYMPFQTALFLTEICLSIALIAGLSSSIRLMRLSPSVYIREI